METALIKGTTLHKGKYTIVKSLGQGSFGITYLATTKLTMMGKLGQMDTTVNVAIKEFFMSDLNSRSSDGSNVERTSSTLVKNYLNKFRREAENLAKLHHPNIVKVLEVFDENNTTYYVMEFIDGETIDEYIKRKGRLSIDESLIITQEVCSALSYMHGHKMLHLDLKPKNIMRDSGGHIYLIDFGLAKQYNDNGEPESSTTLGLGTPGYAPIEQSHYKQDGTFPATLDIYALGATLYKMLTGKTPPDASYVLNENLAIDGLKKVGVSDSVISVVEKAMAPLKKDRYQTISEMSKAFENCNLGKEETTIGDRKCSEDDEETQYGPDNIGSNSGVEEVNDGDHDAPVEKNEKGKKPFVQMYWKHGVAVVALLLGVFFVFFFRSKSSSDESIRHYTENEDVKALKKHPIVKQIIENMVQIGGGTFEMGGTYRDNNNQIITLPVHRVTLSSFSLGKYEVTQEEWELIMGCNHAKKKGERHPIENVSWNECQLFVKKLSFITGKKFRLPTEAEWEFAAKGGVLSTGTLFSGSNNLYEVAWFLNNSNNVHHEVGLKKPNELGLFDMSGNVLEWCEDGKEKYEKKPVTNPIVKGERKVQRGGAFPYVDFCCLTIVREAGLPNSKSIAVGFRLACDN